jgi:enoyl-CoA hydratase/carnithine racemase
MSSPSSSYANLRVERDGHIAVITLTNPPANTWTLAGLAALRQLIEDLDTDRGVYALIITGDGPKFFCAGADLRQFAENDKAVARAFARRAGEAFEALSRFRGVSIAAINGYAMGGGLECALACDLRIAEEHARLALPEATVGLLPCAGGTQNLPWLVGEGWAKRMILCGERVDAATAKSIGLVEQVVPRGGGLDAAMQLAMQAEKQSPSSVAACKTLIQGARSNALGQYLSVERERFVDLFDTEDQKEGVAAFLAKRKPGWRNA